MATGGRPDEVETQWGEPSGAEPRWPASTATMVAVALQAVLPDRLVLGPRWVLPALEVALVVVLLVASPQRHTRESALLRSVSVGLIALVNLANVLSLGFLVHDLLYGARNGGRTIVYASVPIWLTNVIVFGLWYWELDRGGPAARHDASHGPPDFLFPQMTAPGSTPGPWAPSFLDYLYTSFTNATAFSPTDTMPLTAWAKLLMMTQSLATLVLVALVISRAVNILS